MGKKFDTNPLDPEFPDKVRAEQETSVLPEEVPETHPLFQAAPTEEVTRTLIDEVRPEPGFGVSTESHPVPATTSHTNPSNRIIDGLMFSEKTLVSLSYFPYVGLILGAVILLRTSRTESKLRFHAAQALAAHLAILVIGAVLDFSRYETAFDLFRMVTTIGLLVFVYKAWKDRPIHIEAIEPLTDWLESKLSRDTKWS